MGNDVYVNIFKRVQLQSFVQGDKRLGLPDTNIHGVTEQTCPDMSFLCGELSGVMCEF